MSSQKPDLTKLVQQAHDLDEVEETLDVEEGCRSTRTDVPKGTSGMSTERSRRGQKWQKEAVRRARLAKRASEPRD